MRHSLLGLIWVGSVFGWSTSSLARVRSPSESARLLAPAPAGEAASDLIQEPAHAQSDAVKAFRKTALSAEFPGNGLTLRGWVYKPAGYGPFPAMVWNHGAEKNPSARPELGLFCTQHGYVLFVPVRHGHNPSPGQYFGDIQDYIASGADRFSIQKKAVSLEEEYNQDVVAALNWLKKQAYINANAIAVTGVAYGGLQSLLAAERGLDLRACIAFSPGAMSWGSREIRQRTIEAVQATKVPVFLLQAENDYTLDLVTCLARSSAKRAARTKPKFIPHWEPPMQRGKSVLPAGRKESRSKAAIFSIF